MALKNPSLILYGFQVDETNKYIDFQIVSMGAVLTATLPSGTYNLTEYLALIVAALSAIDPTAIYTATANRSIAGGTQNRITIASSGPFFSILFGSGGHASASIASIAGFNPSDYTGGLSYTGSASTGTAVIPVMYGYNWVSPNRSQRVFGSVNVSAVGIKEAIVFQVQRFFSVEFKYEPESIIDSVWQSFFSWAIQQQNMEFTPDISDPETFYECSLESTEEDSQGLGFEMKEMLPDFPGLYQTGRLTFRQNVRVSGFIAQA